MRWMLRIDGQETGPFEAREVRAYVADGKLRAVDLIRPEFDDRWRPARNIRGFEDIFADAAHDAPGAEDAGEGAPTHDVFVSHSHKDKEVADALVHVLEKRGLRCWIARRDILPGSNWSSSIIAGIRGCRALVLIFSKHSNSSQQVLLEVERAVSRGLPVIPFRIEDVEIDPGLELFIGARHWLDAFSPPMERHLESLAGAITPLLEGLDGASQASPEAAIEPAPKRPAESLRSKRWVVLGTTVLTGAAGLLWTSQVLGDGPARVSASEREGVALVGETVGVAETTVSTLGAAEPAPDPDLVRDHADVRRARVSGEVAGFLEERARDRIDDWTRAAEGGDAVAMFLLGGVYAEGIGAAQDPVTALDWYQKSAAAGEPSGAHALGHALATGLGGTPDLDAAWPWLVQAASAGDPVASRSLGRILRGGYGGAPPALDEAARYFQKSADWGDPASMWELAELLYWADGEMEDRTRAAEWAARARAAGDERAIPGTVLWSLVEALAETAQSGVPIAPGRLEALVEGIELGDTLRVLGDWRFRTRLHSALKVGVGASLAIEAEALLRALASDFAGRTQAFRQKELPRFLVAVSGQLRRWVDLGETTSAVDVWRQCVSDLDMGPSLIAEPEAALEATRCFASAVLIDGNLADARDVLETASQAVRIGVLIDTDASWFARFAFADMCFGVAEALTETSHALDVSASAWLDVGWPVVAQITGHERVVQRYLGRLPQPGQFPPGARDQDAAYFMGFADEDARGQFNEAATVSAEPAFLHVTVEFEFEGTAAPVDLVIVNGPNAASGVRDQLRVLREVHGGHPRDAAGLWAFLSDAARNGRESGLGVASVVGRARGEW